MQLVLKALARMFSLLYGLFQYIFQKEELRILILGASLMTRTTHPSHMSELSMALPPGTQCLSP